MPQEPKTPTVIAPSETDPAILALARALARRDARKASGLDPVLDHRKKPRKRVLKPREE